MVEQTSSSVVHIILLSLAFEREQPSQGKLKLANLGWQNSKSWQTRSFTRQTDNGNLRDGRLTWCSAPM